MARNADIQYIQHVYTSGTAARKLTHKKAVRKSPLPHFEPKNLEPDQKITISIDPLSVCAIAFAIILVVVMVVSLMQFSAAYQENVALQEYVFELRNTKAQLESVYRSSFDLAKVEAQAIAIGMIPAEEAQILQISGAIPAEAAEPTTWETIRLFFRELFAEVR